MKRVKLFVAPRDGTRFTIRLLDPMQEEGRKAGTTLFKEVPPDFKIDCYELVGKLEEADFVVVPQAIKAYTPEKRTYIESVVRMAARKPVLVFLTGDLSHKVVIDTPGVVVFNPSEYRHALLPQELTFAPFTEDLGYPEPPPLHAKRVKPTVSFCGYAGFPSWKTRVKYVLENAWWNLAAFARPEYGAYKRGIYFRRKALKALSRDARSETKFIIRDSFSGNANTISGDPAQLRQEFIDSIVSADFVLAPKGDANFSSRFYETLSLGRIPVLIDTDMVLPFAEAIDYEAFVVRVPFTEVDRVGEYITRFYDSKTEDEWQAAGKQARAAYADFLRFDRAMNRTLPLLCAGGIAAARAGK